MLNGDSLSRDFSLTVKIAWNDLYLIRGKKSSLKIVDRVFGSR